MPGDFASVLLSTSPPIFSSSPRLSFNVVNDMTKSYFFRLTNHCATDATPGSNELLSSSVSSSSSDSLDASYASLANLTNLRLKSARNGRCFSDTDVQRSWQFASAVIQRCSLNRSEPALNAEYKHAADKSRHHVDKDSHLNLNMHLQSNTSKETEIHATNQCDLSALALLDATCSSGPRDADKKQTQLASGTTEKHSQDAALPASAASAATRRNKKGHYVRFADELGKELSAVRVIENVLDMKSASTIEYSDADCMSSRSTPLVVEFAQPVADYARFRDRLDSQNVSLENVLVSGFRISGTVRVRNLAFEKRVFVRVSTDHWLSYTDHYATYVPPNANSSSSGSSPYDSFAFDLGDLSNKLMLRSGNCWSATQQRIEIAVCFTSGSQTFWDNNAGRNYIVSYTPAATSRSQKSHTSSYRPDFSAFRENFGEFTAWNHYDSYNPYY